MCAPASLMKGFNILTSLHAVSRIEFGFNILSACFQMASCLAPSSRGLFAPQFSSRTG